MESGLRQALESLAGSSLAQVNPVSGGDISRAWELRFASQEKLFVKIHPGSLDMYMAESRGLTWLQEAGAIRVPFVRGRGLVGNQAYLALSWIDRGAKTALSDEELGKSLAELHRQGAPSWGFAEDNFIGSLAQSNSEASSWCDFYRERRLAPQIELAGRKLPASLRLRLDAMMGRLDELVEDGSPARLHGDLWSGNVLFDVQGKPVLLDPAVYGGSREVDLAMMRLFGGFSERVFDAYRDAWPLPPGVEKRACLYQLYPLLVHLNLFGTSYLSGIDRNLGKLGF